MKVKKRASILLIVCLIATATFFSIGTNFAQSGQVNAVAFNNANLGELLVKFKDIDEPQLINYQDNIEAALALEELQNNPDVEIVQPNFIYRAAAVPSDPLIEDQFHLGIIEAYRAWDYAYSAEDVVVAIIDSGVDIDHPDLKNNIWKNPKEIVNNSDDDSNGFVDDIYGWDFRDNMPDPRPKFRGLENAIGVQHGTMVAGILAAEGNNAIGITGVAWSTRLMSLRVLNHLGIGDSDTVTRAMAYAIEQGVDIINLSLVGTDYDPLFVNLLNRAYEEGIIVVAAAGNSGVNLNAAETYPVCYNHIGAATIIGVGAIDSEYKRPGFSNYGSDCVDIVAPGVKIFSTRFVLPNFSSQLQYEALFSGTSFATPQVSGAIALMKQMRPSLNAEEALEALQKGATSLKGLFAAGSGFDYALNVAGSVALIEPEVPLDATNGQPLKQLTREFIVYPLGEFDSVVFQYQYPGPIMQTPLMLEDELLAKGMRWTRQSPFTVLINANSYKSKKLWRYNFVTQNQELLFEISADDDQTIGEVAIGNVDFDGQKEVIIASASDSLPLVSIYNLEGGLKYRFQAYNQATTGGALDVALIDFNSDGIFEIATVPMEDTPGIIRIFEFTGLMLKEWNAYSENFNGGATLSSSDVNDDGQMELLVGPGYLGGPHVKIFSPQGDLLNEFFAGDVTDMGGVGIQYFDFDLDLGPEYVMTYKQGHNPVIRIYNQDGQFREELGVFDDHYKGGIGIISI